MPRSYGTTNAAPYASAPAVGAAGDTYYNTASKTLYLSDGTSWNAVSGGGAAATACYWLSRVTSGSAISTSSEGTIPIAAASMANGFTLSGSGVQCNVAGKYVAHFILMAAFTTTTNSTLWASIQQWRGGTQIVNWDNIEGVQPTGLTYSQVIATGEFDLQVGDILYCAAQTGIAGTTVGAQSSFMIWPMGGPKGDTGAQGPDVTAVQSSYFYGQLSAPASVAAAATATMQWTTTLSNGITLASSTNITFTQTGKYRVATQITGYAAAGGGNNLVTHIMQYTSGGTLKADRPTGSAQHYTNQYWSAGVAEAILDVVAGDYVQITHSPSVGQNLLTADSWVEVTPVGGVKGDPGATGATGPVGGWGTATATITDYNSAQALVAGIYNAGSTAVNGPPSPPAPATQTWALETIADSAGNVYQRTWVPTLGLGTLPAEWMRTVTGVSGTPGFSAWLPLFNNGSQVTDLNTATATGVYATGSGATNRPGNVVETGVLEVNTVGGYSTAGSVVQVWTGTTSGNQFTRKLIASTWSPWLWITPSPGVIAYKYGTNAGLAISTTPVLVLSLTNVPLKANRLYRMTLYMRAITTTSNSNLRFQYTSGTSAQWTSNLDSYVTSANLSYTQAVITAIATVTGDGTYSVGVQATSSAVSAGTIYTELGGYMMIEDLGNNQGQQ